MKKARGNRLGSRSTSTSAGVVSGRQAGCDAELGSTLGGRLGQETRGAMYPDAYGCAMYKDALVMPHHAKYWGANFQWDDFIPMFKAEHFDSEALLSSGEGSTDRNNRLKF